MGEDSQSSAPARYRAFISYSHADTRFAGWLHRKLEAWELSGQTRLTPIFIDRAELAAGPDLSAQVRGALAGSAALIVVASPAARASRWVAQEISLFRELNPDRPVLAALLQGEPGEAFPDSLLVHRDQTLEPLAADFREGHDGKRLALLKIVAGLTAQPLDRLIQRDAQSRQRRVMAVTAGAVLLSLILAAALIVALRARTEAEHQRAEAEGMVEFMLTDLRDKLKGVGRLDVMEAVNERALAHYAGERDLDGLPDDVLLRRARLLQAMAEDDLSTTGRSGKAQRKLSAASRVTADLLARNPTDPVKIFDHAQSEYWLGYVAYLRRSEGSEYDRTSVAMHWTAYRRLAAQLVAINPMEPRWRKELAYAEGNLCTLNLETETSAKHALAHCVAAREAMEQVARNAPDSLGALLDVANRLAWEADALGAIGQHSQALAARNSQTKITTTLAEQYGEDLRVQEANFLAQYGLAKALLEIGRQTDAALVANRAKDAITKLRRHDPANRNWVDWDRKLRRQFSDDDTHQP